MRVTNVSGLRHPSNKILCFCENVVRFEPVLSEWDFASGEETLSLTARTDLPTAFIQNNFHNFVYAVAYRPDGNQLAATLLGPDWIARFPSPVGDELDVVQLEHGGDGEFLSPSRARRALELSRCGGNEPTLHDSDALFESEGLSIEVLELELELAPGALSAGAA